MKDNIICKGIKWVKNEIEKILEIKSKIDDQIINSFNSLKIKTSNYKNTIKFLEHS